MDRYSVAALVAGLCGAALIVTTIIGIFTGGIQ